MEITIIQLGDENIAEVKGSDVFIHNLDDGLQLMVDCGAQDAYKAIIYQENITDDFFELKTWEDDVLFAVLAEEWNIAL